MTSTNLNKMSHMKLHGIPRSYQAMLDSNQHQDLTHDEIIMLLFKYCKTKTVDAITEANIAQYMVDIKTVHPVGGAKCHSVASAYSFFYKHL